MRFIVDPFDGFLIALHTPDTTTEERRFLAQHPTALDDI